MTIKHYERIKLSTAQTDSEPLTEKRKLGIPRQQKVVVPEIEILAAIDGLPSIIGDIDCTRNRLKLPSKNITIVTADLEFVNIVARWPGWTHDSCIFENSRIRRNILERDRRIAHLVGDGKTGHTSKPGTLLNVFLALPSFDCAALKGNVQEARRDKERRRPRPTQQQQ
ncbi:hypothetical protein B566_EDAN001053 [Ephemera danica]|nr:hypothetical protein B566_EDAN001053 [Ephemera danica]